MGLLAIAVISTIVITVAYATYGRLLARLFKLDPNAITPAVEKNDGQDYVPIETKFLMGQHFSAIAAAGPIVGPILAGLLFGWLPALAWILIGCVFIGGTHDFSVLIASVRHNACSITEVARRHMSRRAFLLFLFFIWIALVYVIVVFTDITASAFVYATDLENGRKVPGGAIATSSLFYLVLPIAMGLLMRYAKLPLKWATIIFLPLIGVAIWAGPKMPFNLDEILNVSPSNARKIWDAILLAYCLVASLVPMWALLQPRGHLGGYFLYVVLAAGGLGLLFGGEQIRFPAFKAWDSPRGTLAPILFITIACGACSGFHALVSSGTTSKQIKNERQTLATGYGAMLLEGLVAVVSLCFLMMLAPDNPLTKKSPNFIYANGIGRFLSRAGIPQEVGITFGMLAFTTFVYDTLDVSTRLGRYIIEELTGWRSKGGKVFAGAVMSGAPMLFVARTAVDAKTGVEIPAWKTFWDLFGASNQLLAALALMTVTVWLFRSNRGKWIWPALGLPTAIMYIMSTWALATWAISGFTVAGGLSKPTTWVALLLLGLAAWMLVEAIIAFRTKVPPGAECGGSNA
ncbi:MAG TPA: carbon starvation CstA family protein [Candidatus Brocadiia bacterium]|nr:carbon starvation CstA family protein [Candidatus Brocadiia bacterium]